MTYVITEACVGTKDQSCVEVCPVDCIHPTVDDPGFDQTDQLHIDPAECIDCDACAVACPVGAPMPELRLSDEDRSFAQINADYFSTKH